MSPASLEPEVVEQALERVRAWRPALAETLRAVSKAPLAPPPVLDESSTPSRLDPRKTDDRPFATFVTGCGRGAVMRAMAEGLRHTELPALVILLETDPRRLLASFVIDDWASVLAEPRIRFAVGPEIETAVQAAVPKARAPLLERVLAPGVDLVAGEPTPRAAGIQQAFDEAVLATATRIRRRSELQAAAHPVVPGGPTLPSDRWRIFSTTVSDTTALRNLAPAILDAAARAGHRTSFHLRWSEDPFANSEATIASLDAEPDLVLSFLRPGHATVPWRSDFPSLVLVSSNPRLLPIEKFGWSRRDLVVVTEPEFAAPYRPLGVEPLIRPLATEVPPLEDVRAEKISEDVLVVGNIPEGTTVAPGLPPALVSLIGELADDWVRHPTATLREVIATTNIEGDEPFMMLVGLALGYEATRRRRIGVVTTLAASGLKVRVHGEKAWAAALAGTAAEGAWKGWLPPQRQAGMFRAAPMSISVNSFTAPGSLNMRSFAIPAAGGVMISDDRPPLRQAFRIGVEAESFRRLDELPDQVANLLRDADRRNAISAAGRARVVRDHSWDAWWRWAEARLRERFPTR